jgi:hypothetical protein
MNIKKGFTIIEFLVFMGLFSIVIVIMMQIFVSMLDVSLENKASSSIDQDGDYLLARLAADMNVAQAITIPSSLGTPSATLRITLNDGSIYTYSLLGTVMQLNDTLGTYRLNSSDANVSNLTFTQLGKVNGKNSIKIHFTLTSTTKKRTGADIKDFDTTLGIR